MMINCIFLSTSQICFAISNILLSNVLIEKWSNTYIYIIIIYTLSDYSLRYIFSHNKKIENTFGTLDKFTFIIYHILFYLVMIWA